MVPYYDGLLAFLFRQLFYGIPEVPPVDLSGKTVLLTGANSGVGYALMSELAMHGAEVITAVRSVAKGNAARRLVLDQIPDAHIEVRECDLASFESVMKFLNQIALDGKTFDIVILNAAVWCSGWTTSADGNELCTQVNIISNALLAISLLPRLRYDNEKPRLVFVTSEGHAMVPTGFSQNKAILDCLNQKAPNFDHYNHYYSSKLFGMLWALALSRRLDRQKVEVVLVSPGLCKSELFRNVRSAPTDLLARCFARSCNDGARMVMLASITDTANSSGCYFSQGSLVPISQFCSGTDGLRCQEQLWGEILEIMERVSPDFDRHLQVAQ